MQLSSISNRHVRRLIKFKIWLVLVVVLLSGLLVGGLHLAVMSLPGYKGQLEQWLSTSDFQVSIGRIQGRWDYLRPTLEAFDIQISNGQGNALLNIPESHLELSALGSALQQVPVFNRIVIKGLALDLELDAQQQWHLVGFDTSLNQLLTDLQSKPDASGGAESQFWPVLLSQGEVDILDAVVTTKLPDQSQLKDVVNLSYRGQGDDIDLDLEVRTSQGESIKLAMRAEGMPGDDFSGQFYLDLPNHNWAPLLSLFTPSPTDAQAQPWIEQLQRADAGAELWGHWNAIGELDVQGRIDVPVLELADPTLKLEQFSTQLRLQLYHPDNWQLQLQQLVGQYQGQALPLSELNLKQQADLLALGLPELDLQQWYGFVRAVAPVPPEAAEVLQDLNPSGQLRNLTLSINNLQRFITDPVLHEGDASLRADLHGVTVSAWGDAPAISGVDGLLQSTLLSGRIDLQSSDFGLSFPRLFPVPWQYELAQGVVSWRVSDTEVWVDSEHLQLRRPGLTGNGRFSLLMPYAKEEYSEFSLLVGMDDSQAEFTPMFLPEQALDAELFTWLKTAFRKGTLNSGGFMYHGPFESWAPSPSIQMFFDVDGVEMQYDPQWPLLEDVSGMALVKGDEVLVESPSARILNSDMGATRVVLVDNGKTLKVSSKLSGPAADIKTALVNSPIGDTLGSEFAEWTMAGTTASQLELELQLTDMDTSAIRTRTQLQAGRYYSEAHRLSIDELSGQLIYDSEQGGLSAQGLQGQFFAQPVEINILPSQRDGNDFTTVQFGGEMEIARFNEWLQRPELDVVQGTARYAAAFDICHSGLDCTLLTVTSDLQGVETLGLPEPLAKSATEMGSLQVRSQWGEDKQWLRIMYGNLVHTLLLLDAEGLRGGEIVLGGKHRPQVRRDGLFVSGGWPVLDVDAWQAWAAPKLPQSVSADKGVQIDPLFKGADVQFGRLLVGDTTLRKVDVQLGRQGAGWQAQFSSDRVAGTASLPSGDEAVYEFDLARLHWPASPKQKTSKADFSDPLADIDPRTLPAMNIKIDSLKKGQSDYGAWALQLEPTSEGVKIPRIVGHMDAMEVDAALWWLMDTNNKPRSQIRLNAKADELAAVQKAWGQEVVVEGEQAKLDANFTWPSSPLGFSKQNLSGHLAFTSGKGRFNEIRSGEGFVKLFGMFNIKTLGRRLNLDFSDLSEQGFSFDSITGEYSLEKGVARSIKPLEILGPGANMRLEGAIDLVHQNMDQDLVVSLPASENISLGTAFLVSPQIGGAVYLVDRLLGQPLSKIVSAGYHISGPWDDPVVKPLNPKKDQPEASDNN